MSIPVFQVDAFTSAPFAGNPAAVCLLPKARPEPWMQDVAREMNLSETAFLVPRDGSFGLRWFTPEVEVELCGHATLASSHVLWNEAGTAVNATLDFFTASGTLHARRAGELIELDFPARPLEEIDPPPGLGDALGAEAVLVGGFWADLALFHYGDAIEKPIPLIIHQTTRERIEREMAPYRRVWYVRWGPMKPEVADLLMRRFEVVRVFRGLEGDIDRGGLVSTGDASIIKPKFGQTPTDATAQFDYDVDGLISMGDFSLVKSRFGHPAPECP